MSTTPAAPRWRASRWLTVGVVLGAALALLLAVVWGGAGEGDVTARTLERSPGTSDAPANRALPAAFQAPLGSCLTWTADDASDAARVACSEPHLFEISGTVTLYQEYDSQAGFPTPEQWRGLVDQRCSSAAQDYLDGRFDPSGRYSVGGVKPSLQAWQSGDRELRCGLQAVGSSGTLYPTSGTVAQAGQADVYRPGTCLGIDGKKIGDPVVACDQPHAVEVAALVDLGSALDGDGYPPEEEQDEFLAERCNELAAEYAGGEDVVRDKGLTVFWQTLTERSWQAGTRMVECRLAASLPDESGFAPVTGSVTGEVDVGDEPAEPDPRSAGPATTPLPTPSPPAPPSPSGSAPDG